MDNFNSLVKQLCEATNYNQIQVVYAEIDSLAKKVDISDELCKALQEQLLAKNWLGLGRLIFIVQRHPKSKYTPVLCNLLDNYREDIFMEAIVDAFLFINDPESVPSLIRALNYRLPGDADRHFNRKIVIALSKIGTEAAVEGIKKALKHSNKLVKEEATKRLQRLTLP